jgi:hypothetical protein
VGVYLLGMNSNMAYFGSSKFWADKGIIHCEDAISNTYCTMSIDEALRRVDAVRNLIGTTSNPGVEIDLCERESMMRSVEQMLNVIRRAQDQGGGPENPQMVSDMEARRKKLFIVSVPSNIDFKVNPCSRPSRISA